MPYAMHHFLLDRCEAGNVCLHNPCCLQYELPNPQDARGRLSRLQKDLLKFKHGYSVVVEKVLFSSSFVPLLPCCTRCSLLITLQYGSLSEKPNCMLRKTSEWHTTMLDELRVLRGLV